MSYQNGCKKVHTGMELSDISLKGGGYVYELGDIFANYLSLSLFGAVDITMAH